MAFEENGVSCFYAPPPHSLSLPRFIFLSLSVTHAHPYTERELLAGAVTNLSSLAEWPWVMLLFCPLGRQSSRRSRTNARDASCESKVTQRRSCHEAKRYEPKQLSPERMQEGYAILKKYVFFLKYMKGESGGKGEKNNFWPLWITKQHGWQELLNKWP